MGRCFLFFELTDIVRQSSIRKFAVILRRVS